MTVEDYLELAQGLIPFLLVAGAVVVEIINAIRGTTPYTISLLREFRKILTGSLGELTSEDWMFKINGLACIILLLCLLGVTYWMIKTIFLDYAQMLIPFICLLSFAFLLDLTFRTSVAFISSNR